MIFYLLERDMQWHANSIFDTALNNTDMALESNKLFIAFVLSFSIVA